MEATRPNSDTHQLRIELWHAGLTDREAAAALNMTTSGYAYWRKKHGYKRRETWPNLLRRAGEYDPTEFPPEQRRRIRRFGSDLVRHADGARPTAEQIGDYMDAWTKHNN